MGRKMGRKRVVVVEVYGVEGEEEVFNYE